MKYEDGDKLIPHIDLPNWMKPTMIEDDEYPEVVWMGDFGLTGFSIFAMIIYGFVAVISDKILFNWKIAGGIVIFVFVIELISNN